jgi:hypothetical protein
LAAREAGCQKFRSVALRQPGAAIKGNKVNKWPPLGAIKRMAAIRPTVRGSEGIDLGMPACVLWLVGAFALASCSTATPAQSSSGGAGGSGHAGGGGATGGAAGEGRGGDMGGGDGGSAGGGGAAAGRAGSGAAGTGGGAGGGGTGLAGGSGGSQSTSGSGGQVVIDGGVSDGGGADARPDALDAATADGAAGDGGTIANPPPPLTGTAVAATVKVTRGTAVGRLPAGSAGFSFEKSHLSDGFFTATHASLVAMFKLLGPGIVRIGADDVNNSVWVPNATFVTPGTTSANVGTAEVDALAAFLAATGWKAIYAVNMRGSSTPQTAVTELTYVVPKLGANLAAVEIGNELNLYPISDAEGVWRTFAQAIRKAFPSTLIAGPGDFEDINYCTKFVGAEASLIDAVTHHYYRGQAGTSTATAANLVNMDPVITSGSQSLASAVKANNIRGGFRYGETNTYSSHGQAGISDALLSALWGVNFMLTTAQLGSVGVNFHGGGQNQDGNVCPNGVSSCDRPFRYSPLIEVDSRVTAAAPLFYGMLLVSRIDAGDMFATSIASGSSVALRAYAVAPGGSATRVVLVNSESSTGVNATIDVGTAITSASAMYLRGPSLTSTTGITFGEAAISAAGAWTPKPVYTPAHTGTTVTVPVPAASAVLISCD